MRQVVNSNIKHLISGGGNLTGEAFQNAQRVLPQPLGVMLTTQSLAHIRDNFTINYLFALKTLIFNKVFLILRELFT